MPLAYIRFALLKHKHIDELHRSRVRRTASNGQHTVWHRLERAPTLPPGIEVGHWPIIPTNIIPRIDSYHGLGLSGNHSFTRMLLQALQYSQCPDISDHVQRI